MTCFLNKGNIGPKWVDNVTGVQPKHLPKDKPCHRYLLSIVARMVNTYSSENLPVVALTVKAKQSTKHFI